MTDRAFLRREGRLGERELQEDVERRESGQEQRATGNGFLLMTMPFLGPFEQVEC